MDKQEKHILVGTLILVILYCLFKRRYYDILILLGGFSLSFALSKNLFYSLLATVLIYVIYFNTSSNSIMEGMTDKKKKQKSSNKGKKKPVKKSKKESVPEEEQEEEESHIDIGSTFMKAYKNLSPEAIDGLGKDTRDLIGTQQKLMSTLNTLGPTLKEGKKVLDTFKNYFDDSDLVKM
jgi:hypothetical protein